MLVQNCYLIASNLKISHKISFLPFQIKYLFHIRKYCAPSMPLNLKLTICASQYLMKYLRLNNLHD